MLSWSSRGIDSMRVLQSSRREPSGSLAEDPKGSSSAPCQRCEFICLAGTRPI